MIISNQLKPKVWHISIKSKGQICIRFSIQQIWPPLTSASGQSQILHYLKLLTGGVMAAL